MLSFINLRHKKHEITDLAQSSKHTSQGRNLKRAKIKLVIVAASEPVYNSNGVLPKFRSHKIFSFC